MGIQETYFAVGNNLISAWIGLFRYNADRQTVNVRESYA